MRGTIHIVRRKFIGDVDALSWRFEQVCGQCWPTTRRRSGECMSETTVAVDCLSSRTSQSLLPSPKYNPLRKILWIYLGSGRVTWQAVTTVLLRCRRRRQCHRPASRSRISISFYTSVNARMVLSHLSHHILTRQKHHCTRIGRVLCLNEHAPSHQLEHWTVTRQLVLWARDEFPVSEVT